MRATKRLVPQKRDSLGGWWRGGERERVLHWSGGVLYPRTGWMHPLMIHAMRVVLSARKMLIATSILVFLKTVQKTG